MSHLLYTIKSFHNTTIFEKDSILVHNDSNFNSVFLMPVSNKIGLISTLHNFTAISYNSRSLMPFSLYPCSAPRLSHLFLLEYNNNVTYLKDVNHGEYLSANRISPAHQCGGFRWSKQLKEWETFSLVPIKTDLRISNFRKNFVKAIYDGSCWSVEYAESLFIIDLLINYYPPIYLKSNKFNDIAMLKAELEHIYKHVNIDCSEKNIAEDNKKFTSQVVNPELDHLANLVPYVNGCPAPIKLRLLARASTNPSKKCCILATARNEGIYLLQFIAYYRALGITDFFIYTNNNDDGSDSLLNLLAELGYIKVIYNNCGHIIPQFKAYGHALSILQDILDYKWTILVDIDEFLVLDGREFKDIDCFLDYHESLGSDHIAIPWRTMCSNGELFFKNIFLLENFRYGILTYPIKSIFKTNIFYSSHCHSPYPIDNYPAISNYADGTLFSSRNYDKNGSSKLNSSIAEIKHFEFKSFEEYIIKYGRNAGNQEIHRNIDFSRLNIGTFNYFMRFFTNTNTVKEEGIFLSPHIISRMHYCFINLLENPSVWHVHNNLLRSYYDSIKIYKSKLLEYLDSHQELHNLVMNLLAHHPDGKSFFKTS